jgi:hypothetical protein
MRTAMQKVPATVPAAMTAAAATMAGLGLAAAATAGQIDMAAMAKWQNAKVVHYRIVASFDGAAPLPGSHGYGEVKVKDQVTIDLDWDVSGNAVVGTPTYTDTPTTVIGTTPGLATKCAPPTLGGVYEHFQASSIGLHPSGVELKGTRRVPAAQVPSQWPSSCAPQAVPASQEAVSEIVAVMSPMMLVMPNGANPNLVVAADRKSFAIRNKGWTWTYTPTIVK